MQDNARLSSSKSDFIDRSSREHSLDAEDDEKFRTACIYSNRRYSKRWLFMYCCMGVFGMRVSEMCHIQLDWLDVSEPGFECIRIPSRMQCNCYDCTHTGSKKRAESGKGVWYAKTKSSARVIPGRLNIEVFWFIHTFLKDAKTDMEIYHREDQVPRARRHVWEVVKRLGKEAGTKKTVFPHALRATAATRFAQRPDITASELMTIMGWSRIETANEYIKMRGRELMKRFTPSELVLEAEAKLKEAQRMKEEEEKKALENIDFVPSNIRPKKPEPVEQPPVVAQVIPTVIPQVEPVAEAPKEILIVKEKVGISNGKPCPICEEVNEATAKECKNCGAEL